MLKDEKVREAADYIRRFVKDMPKLAVVLGSGLGKLAQDVTNAGIIPYSDIPYWPRSTAPGHAGRLVIGSLYGLPSAVMQGRCHYYEGYSMSEVTFPVRVFHELGIESIILTNASGGINENIAPGSLVAIEDHINYMGNNPLIGDNVDDWGPRFPDMTWAYDRDFLEILLKSSKKCGVPVTKGIYIAFSGPSFETPAEIRMASRMGADIVGMSTVPEVIAANHMSMRVCGISCVANYAAGIKDAKLTHEEVLSAVESASGAMCDLLATFI